ncbi:MAG: cytochrome C oxidase subunit IV family protein [Pirellulaceae bacterium]|nr:cytochrome C oxidase subunit IV family protein [Pirellulaceae bacterium]
MSDSHYVNRTKLFSIVFFLLVGLTAISFAVAGSALMDQPVRGWTAMMIISCAKALLVIIFFMHLKWESTWKYVLTIPAAVMSTLLVLILIPDIGNRTDDYAPTRQKFAASDLNSHQSSDDTDAIHHGPFSNQDQPRHGSN